MIISFGYDNNPPPRAHKVFDVRDLTHQTSGPEFDAKRQEILQYVKAHPNETVAIGCKKGKHRSPRLVQDVAAAVRQSYLHRD